MYSDKSKFYFMADQPVLITSNSSMKSLVDHKTVLMIVLWSPNMNDNSNPWTQSNNLIYTMIIT